MADAGFPRGEAPTPDSGAPTYYFAKDFAENCVNVKEFIPRGGVHPGAPLVPPLF